MINAQAIAGRWFKLVHIEECCGTDGYWGLKWRKLDSHSLFVMVGGEGIISVESRVHLFHQETLVFCRPGQGVWIEADLPEGGRVYQLYFDMEELSEEAFPLQGELPVGLTGADIALCEEMAGQWRQDNKLLRLRSQAAFHAFICSIALRCSVEERSGLKGDLARVKRHMEQYYHEEITMEQLAETMRVSARHFRRLFKEAYKISATEYLTELRINHAKRLMVAGDAQLADIAQQAGYQNESHFRRMFKQHVGMPPALYTRNRKFKIGAYSWPNIGQLLPLDLIPHAAPIDQYWTDHYKRRLGGDVTVRLAHDYELNRQLLEQLRPDYIVGIDSYVSEEERQRLGQIASCHFVPWESEDWKTHLRLVGQFLNRSVEAERWLRGYDEQAGSVSESLAQWVDRERLMIVLADEHGLHRWTGTQSDGAMGYPFPFALRRFTAPSTLGFQQIALDELRLLAPERLLLLLSEDPGSQRIWRRLQVSPEWGRMGAVERGRTHVVPIGPPFDYTAYNHGLILKRASQLFEQLRL